MITTIQKIFFSVLAMTISIFTARAQDATVWQIDKSHSFVNFTINHLFSTVLGSFKEYDGDIYFDLNNLSGSRVDFTIKVNSIHTGDDKRDEHLLNEDFFNAQQFPTITFRSTSFKKNSENEVLVSGKLTIKNQPRDVVLPLKVLGEMQSPIKQGIMVLGLVLDTKIKRSDYGVGTGSFAATAIVGDEVNIHIPMELNRKK